MPVLLLIIGGSRSDRLSAVRARVPAGFARVVLHPETLPFTRAADFELPPSPRVLLAEYVERAFPNAQLGGTRLVLTQSAYLIQTWLDALEAGDAVVVTAERAALEQRAPEALRGQGPWARFEILDLDAGASPHAVKGISEVDLFQTEDSGGGQRSPLADALARAYSASSTEDRLRQCRAVVSNAPSSPVAWLALAGAWREQRDGYSAREALDRAAALAPEWEAVHYESGKLWLALDDMARARRAFQRAAELMPTFSAACSNLGATAGELGDPHAALAAFEQALRNDPCGTTIVNNIGVVSRELGRLDESEAAFRRLIDIAPEFVFGHYNLGHTLFLAGKYQEAQAAYEEGQRRDPEKNRRQGCRLAMVRLATGDQAGAERDLWRSANEAPADERADLLLEAYEIATALQTQHPERRHEALLGRIGAEIAKSE